MTKSTAFQTKSNTIILRNNNSNKSTLNTTCTFFYKVHFVSNKSKGKNAFRNHDFLRQPNNDYYTIQLIGHISA